MGAARDEFFGALAYFGVDGCLGGVRVVEDEGGFGGGGEEGVAVLFQSRNLRLAIAHVGASALVVVHGVRELLQGLVRVAEGGEFGAAVGDVALGGLGGLDDGEAQALAGDERAEAGEALGGVRVRLLLGGEETEAAGTRGRGGRFGGGERARRGEEEVVASARARELRRGHREFRRGGGGRKGGRGGGRSGRHEARDGVDATRDASATIRSAAERSAVGRKTTDRAGRGAQRQRGHGSLIRRLPRRGGAGARDRQTREAGEPRAEAMRAERTTRRSARRARCALRDRLSPSGAPAV